MIYTLIETAKENKLDPHRYLLWDLQNAPKLKEIKLIYSHIIYAVVLERFPLEKDRLNDQDYSDSILPDGIEEVHPRYAIA